MTRAQCEAIALAESPDLRVSNRARTRMEPRPTRAASCMQLKVAGKGGAGRAAGARGAYGPANRAFTCGRPASERCHCHAAASLGALRRSRACRGWTSDDAAFHGDRLDAREIGVRGPSARLVFQLAPGAGAPLPGAARLPRRARRCASTRAPPPRSAAGYGNFDASARRLSEDAASERGDEEPDPPPSKSTHSNSSPLEPSPSSLELAPDPESSSKEASRAAGAEMPDQCPGELPADCADSRALNYNPPQRTLRLQERAPCAGAFRRLRFLVRW